VESTWINEDQMKPLSVSQGCMVGYCIGVDKETPPVVSPETPAPPTDGPEDARRGTVCYQPRDHGVSKSDWSRLQSCMSFPPSPLALALHV